MNKQYTFIAILLQGKSIYGNFAQNKNKTKGNDINLLAVFFSPLVTESHDNIRGKLDKIDSISYTLPCFID